MMIEAVCIALQVEAVPRAPYKLLPMYLHRLGEAHKGSSTCRILLSDERTGTSFRQMCSVELMLECDPV